MSYALSGDFVECCDCFTVCPCWVNDVPDEDHCSALYLWSFADGSQIDGVSVAGLHVAAATFHAVRAGGQAMFFIDAGGAGPKTERVLFDIFSNKLGGTQFEGLVKLLGVYLGYRPATITSAFQASKFDVTISINGQTIATADGEHRRFENHAAPMTLRNAALGDELGIGAGAAIVQKMGDLTVDVAALPGGPLNLRGRWGARGAFRYEFAGPLGGSQVHDEPEDQDADDEG